MQIKLFTHKVPRSTLPKGGWGGLGVVAGAGEGVRGEPGCLPFTGANRSVHGLGKWYAKFRTG